MKLQRKYSKISSYRIEKIINHFVVDVEASKTAELLGFNRNSIENHYRLFRRLIVAHQAQVFRQLKGTIEVDESYFGARRMRGRHVKLKRGRGTRKQPVFGIYERQGRVYTQIINNCSGSTLQTIIERVVELNSEMNSDGWTGYDGLVDVGYDKHYRVNHSQDEFSDLKGHHVNGIEAFWSYTKRRLAMFNGVRKTHFELFLKECEWRYQRDHATLKQELRQLLASYVKQSPKLTA